MLTTVHPTLNVHMYDMRPTCVVYVVWRHFIPKPSTPFFQVPWSVLWLCHQLVTDVTVWQINPSPSCSKNRKEKKKKKKNEIKWKENKKWSPLSTILTYMLLLSDYFKYFETDAKMLSLSLEYLIYFIKKCPLKE